MSLPGRRLLATIAALWVIGVAALNAAAAPPDSTWVALGPLPGQGRAAVFALAVDPANNQVVVAASVQGSLLRTTNGGGRWTTVHPGTVSVNTISFDPNLAGFALAGTRGDGALATRDDGATWSPVSGLEHRNVRAFGFALASLFAGTDQGVYTSSDGVSWTQSALTSPSISAIAVEAIHAPVRLLAGSDSQGSGGTMSMWSSLDGGATWKRSNPAIAGTMTLRLVSGPLPPVGNVRPLLAGTNTGLYSSTDNGDSFTPLSGGGLLPTIDYTQATFLTSHYNRFYVASDGGGSGSGGLWRSDDGGQTFESLQPPQHAITALAVSNDERPTLYIAVFQPSTHVASLWTYHDTFGPPAGPPTSPSPLASAARLHPVSDNGLGDLLSSPQLPYVGLGLGALAVVLTAIVAHVRGRYR